MSKSPTAKRKYAQALESKAQERTRRQIRRQRITGPERRYHFYDENPEMYRLAKLLGMDINR